MAGREGSEDLGGPQDPREQTVGGVRIEGTREKWWERNGVTDREGWSYRSQERERSVHLISIKAHNFRVRQIWRVPKKRHKPRETHRQNAGGWGVSRGVVGGWKEEKEKPINRKTEGQGPRGRSGHRDSGERSGEKGQDAGMGRSQECGRKGERLSAV